MSTPDFIYHIIVPSNSDVYDAFSSTNTPDYTPASLDYSQASSGNTSSDPPEDLSKDLLYSLAISPFHDDPYMKVMQAYNATNNESPIPPPRAHIAPPTVLPPSPVFEMGESSHMTHLERHEEQIETILNRLDELPLERIENMKDKIEGLGNGRLIIQGDFDRLETKLQEARTQIFGFQREQIRHDEEIVLARIRISTLEMIIEDIQVTMALLPPGFLKPLYPDMINNQDIEHMIPPTPPRDTEPPVESPILLSSMAPKRTSTSAAPTMTQAAIRKLVADSVSAALEAQAATMANTNNTNRNTGQSGTPVARKCSHKEFMSCQPFNFKVLCPTMVPNSEKLMEVFIGGLPRSIEGNVTASKPQTLKEAITIPQRLMDQRTLSCQVLDLQQGGSSDHELQKQRASHWKQPTTSIHNLSCLWRERALQKSVLKSKQQCPRKSILAERQERSPRPERSHGFDVVIGMDWLSKYHARIICDEKVVHIPIDGETLIIRGAAPVARAPYRLAPSEMQELSNQL
ncbi:hypothetical protein Tco_0536327 [Tanacetum coccineum]